MRGSARWGRSRATSRGGTCRSGARWARASSGSRGRSRHCRAGRSGAAGDLRPRRAARQRRRAKLRWQRQISRSCRGYGEEPCPGSEHPRWDDAAVFAGLIDHAALFPPASMSLPEALAEDQAARESAYAHVLGRFVVPAAKLTELPTERPALSVVLSGRDDVALVEGVDGVEAVEMVLDGARPHPPDLIATYRALEPLGVETYFELVLDDRWRNDVPAAVGAVAAVG